MSCGIQQEQGGRAVPVRRVAVCYFGGGKIDDGVAVQVRLEAVNIHEDSKSSHTAARVAPIIMEVFSTMLH